MQSGILRVTCNMLLILTGLLAFSFNLARADRLLFMDDFKDGSADNWEVVDFGEFEVVDETFCFHTICEP